MTKVPTNAELMQNAMKAADNFGGIMRKLFMHKHNFKLKGVSKRGKTYLYECNNILCGQKIAFNRSAMRRMTTKGARFKRRYVTSKWHQ